MDRTEPAINAVATIVANGQKPGQTFRGTAWKTCQALNRVSTAGQWLSAKLPRIAKRQKSARATPQPPMRIDPAIRSRSVIRSQIVAEQSAKALHMLME